MGKAFEEKLAQVPVIALIQSDSADVAVNTAMALLAGGLKVMEVVLRTHRAIECISAVAQRVPILQFANARLVF